MPLKTAQQELLQDIQEWAADVFGAQSSDSRKAKKRRRLADDERRPGQWPSQSLQTAALAQALDSSATRKQATHGMRDTIKEAFSWSASASAQIANAAIILHTPTSVLRGLILAAHKSIGLWHAIRSGTLNSAVALLASEAALQEYSQGTQAEFSWDQRLVWTKWKKEAAEDDAGTDLARLTSAHPQNTSEDTVEVKVKIGRESLRPYQLKAVCAIEAAAPANCCVVLPCGAGKTRVGSAVTASFLAEHGRGACVLVLCLRREGVRQFAQDWR